MNQSVFAIHDSPLYFEISEDDHPTTHPPATVYQIVPGLGVSCCMIILWDIANLI
jgi:hypothetical protein